MYLLLISVTCYYENNVYVGGSGKLFMQSALPGLKIAIVLLSLVMFKLKILLASIIVCN